MNTTEFTETQSETQRPNDGSCVQEPSFGPSVLPSSSVPSCSPWFHRLAIAGRVFLAGIFLWAGTVKLMNPLDFADSIATFKLLGVRWINLQALALPWFEVICAVALLIGSQRRSALTALFGLTVMFALALFSAIVRGIPVDCGCFGSEDPSKYSTYFAFGRDLILLIVVAALYQRELTLIKD